MTDYEYDPGLPYVVVAHGGGETWARFATRGDARSYVGLRPGLSLIDTTPKPRVPDDAEWILRTTQGKRYRVAQRNEKWWATRPAGFLFPSKTSPASPLTPCSPCSKRGRTMTDIDTKHLRELAEAATPGPWEAGDCWVFTEPVYPDDRRLSDVLGMKFEDEDRADAEHQRGLTNATYIAAIDPPTLIALLDEIELLRGDAGWEYYATARKGYVAGEPRVHERGAIQAYEEALDQVTFEQEDETPVVFKRRVGPWEPLEGETDD